MASKPLVPNSEREECFLQPIAANDSHTYSQNVSAITTSLPTEITPLTNTDTSTGMDTTLPPEATTNAIAEDNPATRLLNYYTANYPPDWEFYEIMNAYLQYLISELVAAPGDQLVSENFYSVGNLVSSHCKDFHEFIQFKTFFLFFKQNKVAINERLAILGTKIKINNHQLVYIPISSSKRKLGQVVAENLKSAKNADNSDNNLHNFVHPITTVNIENVNTSTDNVNNCENNNTINDDGSIEMLNAPCSSNSNVNTPNVNNSNVNVLKNEKPKARLYEIFIEPVKDWPTKLHTLAQSAKDFKAVFNKKRLIHITTPNLDTFRAAQSYFESNNIPVRTLDPTALKPSKFLFRGLPTDTPTSDIEDKIREVGLEPIKVAYLTNRQTKRPMPLFLATIRASPFMDRIYNITNVNYISVEITTYNQVGVAQCYRCQAFGHSSLTCRLTPKCLICSLPHWSRDCKDPNRVQKCANCAGPHCANYKGCSYHPLNTKNIKAKIRIINQASDPNYKPAPPPAKNAWKNKNSLAQKISEPPKTSEPPKRYIIPYTGPPPHLTIDPPRTVARESPDTSTPAAKNNDTEQGNAPPQRKVKNAEKAPKKNLPKPSGQTLKPETKTKTSPKEGNKNSLSSSLAEIPQIINLIKEFNETYNFTDFLAMLRDVGEILKGEEDNIEKLVKIFEKLCNYFQSSSEQPNSNSPANG